jgi:hypothetical protein
VNVKIYKQIRPMADILPGVLFPGYEFVSAGGTVTADSVVIPLSALPAVSASEADATTGDGREVMRAIHEASANAYLALDTASRPINMTIGKAGVSGNGVDQYTQSYSASYNLSIDQDGTSLVAEA